ncbi:MAG: ABC transporter ATP-binding protein [Pseudomonadota bacterium]
MIQAPTLTLRGSAAIAGVAVFSDLALEARAGEWTALLGASGVGKSTVLKIFAGLTEGIALDATVASSTGALTGQIALMAQDDLLMPWLSVLDNVLIGARLRGERADRARAKERLAQVGLSDKAALRPRALSGGQRQRAALARTLMEDRAVVLLDEPFSALDALTRLHMQDLSARLLAGRTVLLVTHDPGEAARLAHRILIMTPTGLQSVAPPPGPIPRPVDATEVLSAQASLLSQLRSPSP